MIPPQEPQWAPQVPALAPVMNIQTNVTSATFSWQFKKANDLWTRAQWDALCHHLHNDNPPYNFVIGFRDNKTGLKRYVRSKSHAVDRAISWSWASLTGSAKTQLAFVPYSTNGNQQSRWGGMDFDAHSGESGRARQLATAAFLYFANIPELCIILETSGSGGWHIWAISKEFRSTQDWVKLLKHVAAAIGTPIAPGVCEIFPRDSLPSRFGTGMRAPGCWNPATNTFSEIVWENTQTSLASVLSGNSKNPTLSDSVLGDHFPDTDKKTSFSSLLYREKDSLARFGIKTTATRNGQLASLVGEIFHQVSNRVAYQLAVEQFRQKAVETNADEAEHLASFNLLWQGMVEKWVPTLTPSEREKFERLETDNEREAFRIIRSFSRKAEIDSAIDFPIVRDNLGQRLGITGKGAAGIRDKFVRSRIIQKTASYVPNKFAARFKWTAAHE